MSEAADGLPYRMVRPYRLRFDESTANETIRSAVHLAWAADIAWQHSSALGFGRDWYSLRGLFWLVRAVRIDVLRPIETYATATVETYVRGYRRIAARRHCDIRNGGGDLMARLEIDWVMTNARGIPTRVPEEMLAFVTPEAPSFEMLRVSLPDAPADAAELRVRVARRDLDPLDHVNNSVYVDYLEEALAALGASADGETPGTNAGRLLTTTPRRYEVEFLSSAGGGDNLVGRTWPIDGSWAFRLSREDGTEVFRARASALG